MKMMGWIDSQGSDSGFLNKAPVVAAITDERQLRELHGSSWRAVFTTVATSTTPSAITTYSVRYLANIAALTEAGSYTTSNTYVATGNF